MMPSTFADLDKNKGVSADREAGELERLGFEPRQCNRFRHAHKITSAPAKAAM
jgi:hypothetical protein